MTDLVTLAALPGQMPSITVPENSPLGAGTSATIGVSLLIVAYWSATTQAEWRTAAGAQIDRWTKGKFDWKSLFYWFLGALGLTAILGTSGSTTADAVIWIQDNLIGLSAFDKLNEFVKLALCVVLLRMAIKPRGADKESSKANLIWGWICVITLPIVSDFGAVGSCVVMLLMALKNKNDSLSDVFWGVGCGIMWPLGGGMFTEASLQLAKIMSQAASMGWA
ncbi:hypothetical protein [Streptomyces sp. 5-10]|uniref:hypothetical protein n=1 Tax=Streptomyces sp. 5-10 TaxID=878925 RepID=UPI00168BECA2|nr:hypothetical protein [Streptomyces sp. 5-10]MBD3004853.1 hypothetical protein [Streptomyces sp. 5-10]